MTQHIQHAQHNQQTRRNQQTPTAPSSPSDQIRAVRNVMKAQVRHEERKLAKQQSEVAEAAQYARYGQIADTLVADPSAAPKGNAKIEIVNIHTQECEEIALNPAFDALENAQLLYKKSRKGKRGHETALAMLAETENKIAKLKNIIVTIDDIIRGGRGDDGGHDNFGDDKNYRGDDKNISGNQNYRNDKNISENKNYRGDENLTDDDVARVLELAAEFLPKSAPRGRDGQPAAPVPFKKYEIDGHEIYLGKNSRQNDELSTRFAKPSDIWMHVVGYAGSHVIIRRSKDAPMPPKDVIEKAAQLAVWNSKAKHTSFAEVHVTEARYVRKRRHAPPGEVVAERCKTVRVEPREI